MWIGYVKVRKDDMTLPIGAPGHLEPEDGPVINHQGACGKVHPGKTHDEWVKMQVAKADAPHRTSSGAFATSPGGIVGSWKSKDHPLDPKTGYPIPNEKMPQPVQDLMAKVQKLPTGRIAPGPNGVASRSPFPVELGKQTPAELSAIEHAIGTQNWKLVNVPISQITTRQPWVKGPQIIKMTGLDHSKMDDADRYGTAIQAPDGHYILLDGNHAAALARLAGQTSVKLRVLNCES